MASTVLDVRDTGAPARVRTSRRVPVAALAAGSLAVLEAVGLLATGLAQVDVVLASPIRPAGLLIVLGLGVLAGWIVLCGGGGAALIDGSGRRLVVITSSVELFVVSTLGVLAVMLPLPTWLTGGLPLPLLFALAVALPIGKLLLSDTPSAREWVLQGPRVRARRPDPVAHHRVLCTLTLGVIALGLGAVAVVGPSDAGLGSPASSVVHQP
ncbi:hypothetical protein [Blastococcus saxobsidens]|uniref:Uncharacterized protein n=1 Tax=Blastococcus saxobsidens (strain DD2) TaxID=1146883 RepID=H6RRR0_BLASD|nr:hypothetical protein [Blastococcus saxobsidens]CCG01703.1 conserved membrane protein of unknown function [Blastococcus saxobsidens DD2]